MASVKGEAPVEVKASSSWVTASIPSPAITAGGQPARRSGSRIATRATRRSSRNDFLNGGAPGATPGRRPESTAFFVTSLPVPAVVGHGDERRGRPGVGEAAADALQVVEGDRPAAEEAGDRLRGVEGAPAADPDDDVGWIAAAGGHGRVDELRRGLPGDRQVVPGQARRLQAARRAAPRRRSRGTSARR